MTNNKDNPATCQLNVVVHTTVKSDFDIALIKRRADRSEVITHLLMFYSRHGLPKLKT